MPLPRREALLLDIDSDTRTAQRTLAFTPVSVERPMTERAKPALAILGTRGIPACYGGFETFAERLAIHLVQRGWDVEVYCQDNPAVDTEPLPQEYAGVRLHRIAIRQTGPFGTFLFDWRSIYHATFAPPRVLLSLGYNCAVLFALPRLFGRSNIVNMDGLEWKRGKWPLPIRAWLWCNERLACLLGDHIVADHPVIAERLATVASRSAHITTIPYGADRIAHADTAALAEFGVEPNGFLLVIGRVVPENFILEIVRAFGRSRCNLKLVVLGAIHPAAGSYARDILAAAGPDIIFPGAIYDPAKLASLRCHCLIHIHGHQMGGTNPSLVEALGAGSPILAHDNRFNRWVAGPAAAYFTTEDDCAREIHRLSTLAAPAPALQAMRDGSRRRHAEQFEWDGILSSYENVLLRWWRRSVPQASDYTVAMADTQGD